MITHLKAIGTQLAPLGHPVFIGSAPPSTLPPFIVVNSPAWGDEPERTLNPIDPFEVDVRITSAAATPEGALIVAQSVHATIAPGRIDAPLPVAGRYARLRWSRSEFAGTDDSITLAIPNRHPGYAVDTYRLTSQEIA